MLAAKHIPTDVLAITAGVVLAGLLLLGWRVDGGTAPAAAELELVTASSEDVAVTPEGETAVSVRLRPAAPERAAAREVGVRNATAGALDVAITAIVEGGALSQPLRLRLVARGEDLFSGSLAQLEKSGARLALASREETTLEIHTWIAADAPEETWAGRVGRVRIALETQR